MKEDDWREELPALRSLRRYRPMQPDKLVPPPHGANSMLWARLLETRLRFEAGNNPLALIDGLTLCTKLSVPPPTWLVEASAAMLRERVLRKVSDASPGRNNSYWGQTYEWLKILRRAHTLNNVLLWLRDSHPLNLRDQLTGWGLTERDLSLRPQLLALCGREPRRTITYAVDVAYHMLTNSWAHGGRRLIRGDHILFLPPQDGVERTPRFDAKAIAFWRHEWSALMPETKALFGLDGFQSDIKEL